MRPSQQAERIAKEVQNAIEAGKAAQANAAFGSAWAETLQRVVHLITGSTSHRVRLEPNSYVPIAATDGKDIFINARKVFGGTRYANERELVLGVKGLVYHELGHILLSPRIESPLRQKLVAEFGSHRVWNALEDGRMESIFVRRFTRAASYFNVAILKWVISERVAERVGIEPSSAAFSAILIIGRTYLPREVRAAASRQLIAAVGIEDAAKVEEAIRDFRRTPVEDWEGQYAAVKVVADILRDHNQNTTPPGDDFTHNRQEEGRPNPKDFDQEDEDEGDDADDDGDDASGSGSEPPAEGDEDEDGGEGEDAEAEGGSGDDAEADPDKAAEGDTDDEVDGDEAQGGKEGDGERDYSRSHGNGSSLDDADPVDDGDPEGEQELDLREAAEQALEEALEDQGLREDIQQTLQAVSNTAAKADVSDFRRIVPTNDTRLVQRRVSASWSALKAEHDPVIVRRQRAGRLDTRRLLDPHRQAHEVDFFDRRNDIGSGFDVEAFILLDVSGSMNRFKDAAASALWATVVAAQDEGIRTSVLTFASGESWKVLKTVEDQWDKEQIVVPHVGGGTEPLIPLAWSVSELTDSTAEHRLLITITDGEWGGTEATYRSLYGAANREGIRTLILGIGNHSVTRPGHDWDYDRNEGIEYPNSGHGADSVADVRDILDLPLAIERFVDTCVNAT